MDRFLGVFTVVHKTLDLLKAVGIYGYSRFLLVGIYAGMFLYFNFHFACSVVGKNMPQMVVKNHDLPWDPIPQKSPTQQNNSFLGLV